MPTWRLTFRTGESAVIVADECRREGAHVVLVRWEVVVMEPRAIVVRRVRAGDVERVVALPDNVEPGTSV